MNTAGTGFYARKECHKTESLWNHTTTDHKEGEQLEDRKNVGKSSCNFGDETDQRVQSLMFMMMMMMMMTLLRFVLLRHRHSAFEHWLLRLTSYCCPVARSPLADLLQLRTTWYPAKQPWLMWSYDRNFRSIILQTAPCMAKLAAATLEPETTNTANQQLSGHTSSDTCGYI